MGTIAQASASALYCSTEASWGSTAGGNYQTARITGMDIRQKQENVSSNELSTSREPSPLIRVGLSADASVNFEADVQDLVFEMFLQSVMGNTFQTPLAVSANLDVTSVGAGVCHWSGSTANFASILAGDWVRSSGFDNPANNGVFFVSQKPSALDLTIVNPAAVAETIATGVSVTGSRLVFGTSTKSLTMEHRIATVEPLYHQATGMLASGVTLDLATGAIITGTATLVGKQMKQSTVSIAGTPTAVGAGIIANGVDNVLKIREGLMGTAETWNVARASINIASPSTPLRALGSLGAVGLRVGRPTVTANLNLYMEHGVSETNGAKDLIDAYLAGTQRTGLGIEIGIDDGNDLQTYLFMFHRYNITNAGAPIGGNDSDFFLPLEISAAIETTNSGHAFSIHKI